jgi:endonuclease-3 related protein
VTPEQATAVYQALFGAYGPQRWWPGETQFEIMVGAVLTQNTAWVNVERALAHLAQRVPLRARAILDLPVADLAACLRPVGYFNVKAQRLRALCEALETAGGLSALERMETAALRHWLLAIHGVGRETADDILLYAFERPVFVVDAYTRRLFGRLGLLLADEGYEAIRHRFEATLGPETRRFNEYHALIVRHGKEICRSRPRCGGCCLRAICPFGAA